MPDESADPPDEASRDPDARFLLANERTLLAWLRTALALLASGVGLLQFLPELPFNGVVGVGMLTLGAVSTLVGLQRYRAADAAIRENALPPRGAAIEVLSVALFVLAAVLIALLVTQRSGTI